MRIRNYKSNQLTNHHRSMVADKLKISDEVVVKIQITITKTG